MLYSRHSPLYNATVQPILNPWNISVKPPIVDKITHPIPPLDLAPGLIYTQAMSKQTGNPMNIRVKQLLGAGIALSLMAVIPAGSPQNISESALDEPPDIEERLVFSQTNTLFPIIQPNEPERVVRTIPVVVTAYSSTESQTDSTPFITASGTLVREGIVAANFLPLGTRIKLPELYGDKVFVVEDRMHPRKTYQVDIWFASYWEAKSFGAKQAVVEVLGS